MTMINSMYDPEEGSRDLPEEENVRMSEEPEESGSSDSDEEFKFTDVHSGASYCFADTNTEDDQIVDSDEYNLKQESDSHGFQSVDANVHDPEEELGLKIFDEDYDLTTGDDDQIIDDDDDMGLVEYEEFDELDTNRGAISRFLRPDGEHLNKVGIAFILGVLFLTVFGISMLMSDDKKDTAKKVDASSEQTTAATQVNSENLNPMLGEKEIIQSKTGGDSSINLDPEKAANVDSLLQNNGNMQDANMLQQASTLGPGGVSPNGTMPQTMTSTRTTVSEVPIDPSYPPASQSNPNAYPVYQNKPRRETEGGVVLMRKGRRMEEQNDLKLVQNNNPDPSVDDSAKTIALAYGTRIVLELRDPVRSGIETSVQAKSLAPVKDNAGNVIIPSGSTFEITFNPQEVNGRVFANELIKWIAKNGEVYQLRGSVKGGDGFEGLTGKVIKQGGKSVGGKILGGLKRVGGSVIQQVPGASQVGTVINDDIYGSSDRYSYSTRVVEVAAGTRMLLIIK
jgi:hypothetical protein